MSTPAPALSAESLRTAFSGYPCGVVAIAGHVDGEDHVLIASSFTVGVSMEPPLVMFAVQHSSSTWPELRRAQRLGVSVLGDDHAERTRQLAAKDRSSRFEDVKTTRSDAGAILLTGSPMQLQCSVHATHRAGDHDIVVLKVHDVATNFDTEPLIWHRSGFESISTRPTVQP
jgi:flavin reductase (DIM6/NTAB) family NADH-FMN oxidoreductase RutF